MQLTIGPCGLGGQTGAGGRVRSLWGGNAPWGPILAPATPGLEMLQMRVEGAAGNPQSRRSAPRASRAGSRGSRRVCGRAAWGEA